MAFGRNNIIVPLAALAGLFASYKLLCALYKQFGKKTQTDDEPPLQDEPALPDEPLSAQFGVELVENIGANEVENLDKIDLKLVEEVKEEDISTLEATERGTENSNSAWCTFAAGSPMVSLTSCEQSFSPNSSTSSSIHSTLPLTTCRTNTPQPDLHNLKDEEIYEIISARNSDPANLLVDSPSLSKLSLQTITSQSSACSSPHFTKTVHIPKELEGEKDKSIYAESIYAVPSATKSNPSPCLSLIGPNDGTCGGTKVNLNGGIGNTNVHKATKLCRPPGFSRKDQTIELMKRITVMKNMLPMYSHGNDNVRLIRKLGSGSSGKVYEADTKIGKIALKMMKKKRLATVTQAELALNIYEFYAEATLLADLNHPHILKLKLMIPDLPSGLPGMGTEFLSRDLFYFIHNTQFLRSLHSMWRVVLHVVDAMVYLHLDMKMVHFDLKSSNILLDYNSTSPVWKVADFGLALKNNTGVISLTSQRGTMPYMAPEVILANRGMQLVSEKADVYSFGILMWELIAGEVPYEDMSNEEIEDFVLNGDRLDVQACDVRWKSLMEACWRQNDDQRPSFQEIYRWVCDEVFCCP